MINTKFINNKYFAKINLSRLYKNSLLVIFTSFLKAGFGFLFWMIAARLYVKEDVGLATALMSSMALIILLSRLGLEQSVIRFFPEMDKSRVFGTAAITTTLLSIVVGFLFVLSIDLWSSELNFIKNYTFLFLFFISASSLTDLIGVSFLALRKPEYYFIQNFISGARILLLYPFVYIGALGIFSALGVSLILNLLFSIYILYLNGIKLLFDKKLIFEISQFSLGNYIVVLLMAAPYQILPILILNNLGAEAAAHYYIAYSMAALLFNVPAAFSLSLFVEGSHGENLKNGAKKAILAASIIMIPAVTILYFLGPYLLEMVGRNYIEAIGLLRLMLVSSFFVTICQIFVSIKRVQKDIRILIHINALIFFTLIISSYLFMTKFGLNGIGYAWFISYGLSSLIIIIFSKRNHYI